MIIDHNTLRLWKLGDWWGHWDTWGQGTGVGTWGHKGTRDKGGSNMIIDHNTLRLWKLGDWWGHGDTWGQGTGVGTWGHKGTREEVT